MSEADPTNPTYYQKCHQFRGEPIECIDVIECLDLDFSLGNALKYVWHLGKKPVDPTIDLDKAEWYRQRWLGHGSQRTHPSTDARYQAQETRMAVAGDVAQMITYCRNYLATNVSTNPPELGLVEYVDELITEFMEGYGDQLEKKQAALAAAKQAALVARAEEIKR